MLYINHRGEKDRAALLRLLINDYIKGQVPHTTHSFKTYTQKKEKKLVKKERQQEQTKYTSIKRRKAKKIYSVDKSAINIYE